MWQKSFIYVLVCTYSKKGRILAKISPWSRRLQLLFLYFSPHDGAQRDGRGRSATQLPLMSEYYPPRPQLQPLPLLRLRKERKAWFSTGLRIKSADGIPPTNSTSDSGIQIRIWPIPPHLQHLSPFMRRCNLRGFLHCYPPQPQW